jgi:endonuclease/exonuclease/phosphatase family metal-dependent hydrolase
MSISRLTALCLLLCLYGVQAAAVPDEDRAMTPLRFATFNTSLNDDAAGGLIARLATGDDPRARKVAAIIQRVRPDVVLLNEFDFDPGLQAATRFERDYLGVGQFGETAIAYPYHYLAPVNTGVPSGLDLNGDGRSDGPDDAWGFGRHPGQYGMLVLSRFPIDDAAARTFQRFRWCELPGALAPLDPASGKPFYPDATWSQLRLSSKSHWDLPIQTPQGLIHFLVAHPTPPVFDGPEDRNGRRNHDEIRFWAEYLADAPRDWLHDDQGRHGGLPADAAFVMAGDLNADPDDGDGTQHPVRALLTHPRVNAEFVPRSPGAPAQAASYGLPRHGDSRAHTGDFGPRAGTLRIDYVLPSRQFSVRGGGVFWPLPGQPGHDWIDASDHHLVWLDLLPSPSTQD